jgi:imidazolonepropionase-like amidohydrolase
MVLRFGAALIGCALFASSALAAEVLAPPSPAGPAVQPFVKIQPGPIALIHARLIDGTGSPETLDRTIVIDGGKIAAVLPAGAPTPAGAQVIDLTGKTVIPGLVGMHDHLFYIARPNLDAAGRSDEPILAPQMSFSAPRMYLAAGVTTLRTTGSVEPYTDLELKKQIDGGQLPGPHLDVTGPYLEGGGSPFVQMHQLKDAEDARRTVAFWADQGATSFKAYMYITRAELKAAIDEAHRHGLKITGHLCAVTYPEAAELGIDDLEHGFLVNTQLDPGKKPDVCPDTTGDPTIEAMTPDNPAGKTLIQLLISKHVAVTSTLPVFEQDLPDHAPLNPKALATLSPQALEAYLYSRNRRALQSAKRHDEAKLQYQNDIALERAFVAAGGQLLAGPDPTGNGGVLPGFGDQREVELLVDAGFSAEQAIRIASLNGAEFMGLAARIGSVEAGKDADLVVVAGDPAKSIADIEKVETVFKDGVGYDPAALLASVRGRYGEY